MNKKNEEAHWHHSIGREFEEAHYILIEHFDVITNFWKKQIERPSYYSAGLSVEHYIKGCLALKSINFPKNHQGHDLLYLISLDNDSLKNFFDLDSNDIEQISILNERYYSHIDYGKDDLRYGDKAGLRQSPHPDNLNRIIKKMEIKLRSALLE